MVSTNTIHLNPSEAEIDKLKEYLQEKKKSSQIKKICSAITLDGHQVEVQISVLYVMSLVQSAMAQKALAYQSTEFLFMDRDSLPTEEEQFQAYKAVAEAMGSRRYCPYNGYRR